ncbi:MAG: STAS domain-containing protein [Jejuia sp.]
MDFRITTYNNYFKLKGSLNKKNIHVLQSEFRDAFQTHSKITVSIEDLDHVDRYGVNALASLHKQSIEKNVQLSIVGLGCKELYDHFRSVDEAA